MNLQANAVPGPAPAIAAVEISFTRRFAWALRREFWESRYIYIAPLAVAAAMLIGFASTPHSRPNMHAIAALDPMEQTKAFMEPYDIVGGVILATAMLVAVFYLVDALYGERRDRSILFWKSLPVSDSITVLTKAAVGLVLAPLIGLAVTVLTEFIMLLISSAFLAASGQSVALLWARLPIVRMLLLLLYHILTDHVLWPAPLYCWILLVSAWARRAPFLWAFVPPVAVVYLEKIMFGSRHFLDYLLYRLAGNGMEAVTAGEGFPTGPMTHVTPWLFLSSFGLWAGLAVAAIFLALAIRIRRSQGPV